MMQHTLREGDFDALGLERVPDREEYVGLILAGDVLDPLDPVFDRELHAAVGEGLELAFGRAGAFGEDEIERGNGGFDQGGDAVDVGVVADRELSLVAALRAGVGEVDDARGDEILVRDDDPAAIGGFQDGGAGGHLDDGALGAVIEHDIVAHGGLALQQQDHAGDEIGGDLLQPEADADAERAAEDGDGGEVDAHDRHQEQEGCAENGDLAGLHREFAGGGAQVFLFTDELFGLAVGPAAKPEEERARDRATNERERREADIAEIDRYGRKPVVGEPQKIEKVEQRDGHEDEATEHFEERVGQDIAYEKAGGEDHEEPLAEGDHVAGAEDGARHALAHAGETIGQKRHQERQEHQHEAARGGDRPLLSGGGGQQAGEHGAYPPGDEHRQKPGHHQQCELRPGRGAEQPALGQFPALQAVADGRLHDLRLPLHHTPLVILTLCASLLPALSERIKTN